MLSLLYSPDAVANGGGTTVTVTRRTGNVPVKDADLLNVAQTVSTTWAANPFMVLLWKTQGDFNHEVAAFNTALQQRNTQGAKRNQQTQDLENLDTQVNDAVAFVKTYINDKFGPKNAKAHYAEFGMVHRSRRYELPKDREKRKDALRMMVDAIHANGFGTKTYGDDFWTDVKARYDAALDAATSGAGDVSADVSDLVTMRRNLKKVLKSLLLLLQANYPDTFDQVRRDWGFQKESY